MEEAIKVEFDRIHDEDARQNRRIEKLELQMDGVNNIALSVEKLAINMENMLKEQLRQGARLTELENAPAKDWNNTKKTIFNSAIGAISSAVGIALLYAIINYLK